MGIGSPRRAVRRMGLVVRWLERTRRAGAVPVPPLYPRSVCGTRGRSAPAQTGGKRGAGARGASRRPIGVTSSRPA